MDENKEKDFDDWLESISFVDNDGEVQVPKLTKDESDDPEGDRS